MSKNLPFIESLYPLQTSGIQETNIRINLSERAGCLTSRVPVLPSTPFLWDKEYGCNVTVYVESCIRDWFKKSKIDPSQQVSYHWVELKSDMPPRQVINEWPLQHYWTSFQNSPAIVIQLETFKSYNLP